MNSKLKSNHNLTAFPGKIFIISLRLLFVFCSCLTTASGQETELPFSFYPVGSGARAVGVGGAFIAVADDATAASWNPGGLTQLRKPELSIVGAGFHRGEDISFGKKPEASGYHSITDQNINYLSAAYPFELFNRNMTAAISYQHLFDFTRNWKYTFTHNSDEYSSKENWDFQQTGRLSALGFSYCIQVIPEHLSLGMTFNLWKDGLTPDKWRRNYHKNETGTTGNSPFTHEYKRNDEYSFNGFNTVLGALWRINDKLSIGMVFKTPFKADVEHRMYKIWHENESYIPDYTVVNEEIEMPMSLGIGFLYNVSDNFYMSADIYRTEWDDFIIRDKDGNEICPISKYPADHSDVPPTHQVRIGAEYLLIKEKNKGIVIPLRCGIFYEPAPAEGSPDDFFGFSVGSGFTKNNYFSLDIAYQYRFGNNVGKSIFERLEFSQDVHEHTIYMSMILYKF
ncbi:MAG: hypothetical protein GY749_12260 [Desulfobacteraceae bacterium]|nr:hypothetical protein [Desulfobacteraceae bacterium]